METMEQLNLKNIAGGAAEEVFERELKEVLKNIADVNTEAEAKRGIVMEFKFSPGPDRGSAVIEIQCRSKLAAVTKVRASMFVVKKTGGAVEGYPHDPRQAALFGGAVESKQAM